MPPFYPNLVTLREGINSEQVLEYVEILPDQCGLKDSFADLDLTAYGFRIGFEAHWYGLSGKVRSQSGTEFVREVSSVGDLAAWVSAWGETPDGESIFRNDLLQPKVRFLFRQKDGEIDSGLITNLCGDVVGISNAFGQPDGIAQCIGAVSKSRNGLPLVGYGSQEELNALTNLGFLGLGELRVWLR